MKEYGWKELSGLVFLLGRTYVSELQQALYFNWSASGITFQFHGTELTARFCADYGEEVEGVPWDETAPRRKTWPWVAVYLDDQPEPARIFEVSAPEQDWLLFQSAQPETHRIRVLKRTENYKTFLGLRSLSVEGDILPAVLPPRKRIEFVGDSITCGFGNGSKERDRAFFSAEEDGLLAYGPRAAELLNMEVSCVCISGITAVKHQSWPVSFAMDELYAYTDRPHQEKSGLGNDLSRWDFAAKQNDYVVLNLGTNDAYATLFGGDGEEAAFDCDYLAFLRQIRACNGPDTQIVCALGSMNYYLWHNIVCAVEAYRQQTGDAKIHLYRFHMMHPMDGFGAAGHPSMATHEKMAQEIADVIRSLETNGKG